MSISAAAAKPSRISEFSAKFTPDSVTLTVPGQRPRIVDPEDFALSLVEAVREKNKDATTAHAVQLPYGCLGFTRSGNNVHTALVLPERRVDMKFSRNKNASNVKPFEFKGCLLPNTIIDFSLTAGAETGKLAVSSIKYMASSVPPEFHSLPTERTDWQSSCIMPWANIFGDGRMCYGANSTVPTVGENDFRGLSYYATLLYAGIANNDLSTPSMTAGRLELARKLIEAEYAQLNELTPHMNIERIKSSSRDEDSSGDLISGEVSTLELWLRYLSIAESFPYNYLNLRG